jgi:hypothetical protein
VLHFRTYSDAAEWADKHYRDWENSLSKEEAYALFTYSQDAYRPINAFLREEDPIRAERAAAEARAFFVSSQKAIRYARELPLLIDSAIAKAPPIPDCLRVFRGLISEQLVLSGERLIGGWLPELGYMSTSLLHERVLMFLSTKTEEEKVILEVDLPAGTRAAYVSCLDFEGSRLYELELLLPRGVAIQVESVTRSPSWLTVKGCLEQQRDW